MVALTLMLVSLCRDPRSAATSSHRAEVAAGAAAALDEELPADAWPLDEPLLEPQAAASRTRPEIRTFRQTLPRTLLILSERGVRFPAPPHPRRVIPRSLACPGPRPVWSVLVDVIAVLEVAVAVVDVIHMIVVGYGLAAVFVGVRA